MIHQCITFATDFLQNAEMHDKPPFGEARQIIRTLSEQHGFKSLRALALAAGIPQPTLSRYMAGTTETMDAENFYLIARTLGVTLSELIGEVPLQSSLTVRAVMRLMSEMPNDVQEQFLRLGKALSPLELERR